MKRLVSVISMACILLNLNLGGEINVRAVATEYYVATTGSDSYSGTISSPFKTIQHAASIMVAGDTCIIRGGTYRETVTPTNGTTYQAYTGETVTVSGAELLTGWTQYSGSIYESPMDWTMGDGDQVFVDGTMMDLAKWPNNTASNSLMAPAWSTVGVGTGTTIADSQLTQPNGFWVGGKVFVRGGDEYICQTSTITASTQGGTITFNPLQFSDAWYTPRVGNLYYLCGFVSA